MPRRPRTSCSACRRLKRVCQRDGDGACDACLRADRECDLVGLPKPGRAHEGPERELKLRKQAHSVVEMPLPRASEDPVSGEMMAFIQLAVQGQVICQYVKPEAVSAARRMAVGGGADSLAARALLHASAAAGALSTCDPRFATVATANLCQARALAQTPGARNSALMRFVHTALVDVAFLAGDMGAGLDHICLAALDQTPLTLPSDVSPRALLVHIARATVKAPRPRPMASSNALGIPDLFEEGVGMIEFLRDTAATNVSSSELLVVDLDAWNLETSSEAYAHRIDWERLAEGRPRSRAVKAFCAAKCLFSNFTQRLISPPPPEQQIRAILSALQLEGDEIEALGRLGVVVHAVRAIAHYQLGELQPVAMHSERALRAALEDQRSAGQLMLLGTLATLVNVWRTDLSGAGDALAELLDRVAEHIDAATDALYRTASLVMPTTAARHQLLLQDRIALPDVGEIAVLSGGSSPEQELDGVDLDELLECLNDDTF